MWSNFFWDFVSGIDVEFYVGNQYYSNKHHTTFLASEQLWSVSMTFLFKFLEAGLPVSWNFTVKCLGLDVFSSIMLGILWAHLIWKYASLSCGIFSWITSTIVSFLPLYFICALIIPMLDFLHCPLLVLS